MSQTEGKKAFINPIDPDKITENPHSLEYAHHAGSAIIKPEDQGKIKGRAVSAMEHQTDMQLSQLYEQMQLLASQAKKLNARTFHLPSIDAFRTIHKSHVSLVSAKQWKILLISGWSDAVGKIRSRINVYRNG